MNIVICPDNYFTMSCTILLCSLLENNRNVNDIVIYALIDSTFEEKNKEILKDEVLKYKNATIHFICINEEYLECLKQFTFGETSLVQIPIVTFYRIFLEKILPINIERVLYLDSDMIVRKNLSSLYQTHLENKAIAAVIDTFNYDINIYNNLRYNPQLGYFNAGMLLINLKYWREHTVLKRCIDFMQKYPERVRYLDQDVLNYVLKEEKVFVPLTWNAQTSFFLKKPPVSWELEGELKELINDPCIIHYVGSYKPWQEEYNIPHPYKADFFRYKSLTIWKDFPLMKSKMKKSAWNETKKYILKIFHKMGFSLTSQKSNPFVTIEKE